MTLLTAASLTGVAGAEQEGQEAPRNSSVRPCPDWPMYGYGPSRTFSSDCPSAISPPTVPSLVPSWSFKTPSTVTASPAVVAGVVYVGDWSGTMYALDADDGELVWEYATEPAPGAAFGPIVSSAAVAELDDRTVVVFGSGPRLYALDATDGHEVWVSDLGSGRSDDPTEIESSPVVWDGTVYLGVDVHNHTVDDTGGIRGRVVALDLQDGSVRWSFNAELGQGPGGCSSYWSSPTLDVTSGRVFAASGNCPYDRPWTRHVEAVTALEMGSGDPVWSFQPHEPNRNDWDFGATPNLFTRPDGRRVLGVGNKDGSYYALDPGSGTPLWSTQVAEPGDVQEDFSVGGFIGSPAVWRGDVYGATAFGGPPYQHALDGRDGAIRWQQLTSPSYAASAVVQGVVFTGGVDGELRAFDARSGDLLWQHPLAGPISSGPAVSADRLFIGSGTSSSDACAKDTPPFSSACRTAFEESLGRTGAVHAFELAAPGHRAAVDGTGTEGVLLGAEGNRLHAYDPSQLERHVVIPSAADDPEDGLDINGQICGFGDGSRRFIAGEDTSQPDPPPAWGIFRLRGSPVDDLSAEQLGELRPTYQGGPDGAENYGCGFLSDGRLVTTDVGNQRPGQPPTGQLIVWFPPFEGPGDVSYCKVDVSIPTAGQIHVSDGDVVHVASAREGDGRQAGVHRYSGRWPTSSTAEGGCGRTDDTGAPLVDEGRVERALLIPADRHVVTPSGVDAAPDGGFYVASVFNGVIAEYDAAGDFVRRIVDPPGPPQTTTGTPFGITVGSDGTLFYADLGNVVAGPESGRGSVRRVRFDGDGRPLAPETLAAGFDFPDGLGFVNLGAGTRPPDRSGSTTSERAGEPVATPSTGDGSPWWALLAVLGAGVLGRRRG